MAEILTLHFILVDDNTNSAHVFLPVRHELNTVDLGFIAENPEVSGLRSRMLEKSDNKIGIEVLTPVKDILIAPGISASHALAYCLFNPEIGQDFEIKKYSNIGFYKNIAGRFPCLMDIHKEIIGGILELPEE